MASAKTEPRIVFSVDHGHFFPGGPNWTIASLQGFANSSTVPDPRIVRSCNLTSTEIKEAGRVLNDLDDVAVIERAVAAPLEEWILSIGERVAMAQYLVRRKRELIAAIAMPAP